MIIKFKRKIKIQTMGHLSSVEKGKPEDLLLLPSNRNNSILLNSKLTFSKLFFFVQITLLEI
jgi:hypothetical protein